MIDPFLTSSTSPEVMRLVLTGSAGTTRSHGASSYWKCSDSWDKEPLRELKSMGAPPIKIFHTG